MLAAFLLLDGTMAVTLLFVSSVCCPICSDQLSPQCLSRPSYPEVIFVTAIQRWEWLLSLSSRDSLFKGRQTHRTVWSASKCPDRAVTQFHSRFPKVWITPPEITSRMSIQTRLVFRVCHLVPFRSIYFPAQYKVKLCLPVYPFFIWFWM